MRALVSHLSLLDCVIFYINGKSYQLINRQKYIVRQFCYSGISLEMKGKMRCLRFEFTGSSGMGLRWKKKNHEPKTMKTMHADRTTQLLFPGMHLNTSSRQQCDYNELVHWNVLRMEADPVQTSQKWKCYNTEYLINERKIKKIH